MRIKNDPSEYIHLVIHRSEIPSEWLDPDALLDTKQAAKILGCSPAKLIKDRAEGTGIQWVRTPVGGVGYRRGAVQQAIRDGIQPTAA